MEGRVEINIEDGVADVRLVRSDKMNALDERMFNALIEAGEKVSNDPAVRVVVLSAEGRAFCAGLDMGNFANMAGGEKSAVQRQPLAVRTHGVANKPQKAVWVWRECPVPVIAAVHGVSFGGGFQLALGADIRIVHPDTKMSVMEIKWGLVPDMAGMAIMPTLARDDVVRELTYTGRIFSGEEAKDYGFATKLSDDPRAEALALAKEIALKSPDAIKGGKRLISNLPCKTPEEILLMESVEQDQIIGAPNQIEAVMSTLEKRAPNYT